MKRRILYMIIILISAFQATAGEKWAWKLLPEHARVQFAGNLGVVSAGLGYSFFSDKFQTDLMYGYVPKSIGGNEIHTLASKNTLRLFRLPVTDHLDFVNSLGLSLNYSITNNTFLCLPDQFPKGYYSPNGIYAAPFFSYQFVYENEKNKRFNGAGIYFELGTVDKYVWYLIKTRAFRFSDLWNLAIGITVPLK